MALRFSYSRNVIIGLKCINGFQVISKKFFYLCLGLIAKAIRAINCKTG